RCPQSLRKESESSLLPATHDVRGSRSHVFSSYEPISFARTSSAQAAISSSCINSATQAPSPPAFITAIERAGADAPAIGASKSATSSPKRRQNESTRARMADITYLASSGLSDCLCKWYPVGFQNRILVLIRYSFSFATT